jgi:Tol biopolymer transport system component
LLTRVYREGTRLRLRRRALAAGSGLAAVLLVVVSLVLAGSDTPTAVRTVDQPTSTTATTATSGPAAGAPAPTTTTPTPSSTTAAARYRGQLIAFVRTGDQHNQQGNSVYTVRPDGTDERLLFAEPGPVSALAWSPDGQWLAYNFDGDVYRIRSDGTGRERLTTTAGLDLHPAWRPDGQAVLYTTDQGGIWRLVELSLAPGRTSRPLPVDSVSAQAAASWSPDAQHIAVARDADGRSAVYVADISTGASRRLTDRTGAAEHAGEWSPDGTLVLFTAPAGFGWDNLYIASVKDPHRWREISDANHTGAHRSPRWSPDGQFIVEWWMQGGPGNRCCMSPPEVDVNTANGQHVRRVALSGAWPTWSPGNSGAGL